MVVRRWATTKSQPLNYYLGLGGFINLTNGEAFQKAFMLPGAGTLDRLYTYPQHQGYGYYWSSSPYSGGLMMLYMPDHSVEMNYTTKRGIGYPVRCFQDSKTAPTTSSANTVTFKAN